MSEMNTQQIVVQENGVLIPNELFGREELIMNELRQAGVFRACHYPKLCAKLTLKFRHPVKGG